MKLISILEFILPSYTVFAHCDIPCKIYDPYTAQIGAHSVIRMTQMLMDAESMEEGVKKISHISRLTKVKEDHAEVVKHEVRVIWGDYFKNEQIEKTPGIHELVHKIMLSASKCRQEIDLEESKNLLSLVLEFSEEFYKTKGMETVRISSGFPTEGELVVHK